MTTRRLRYSERKRIDETGSLGDFQYGGLPEPLRWAVYHLLNDAFLGWKGRAYRDATLAAARAHFGWPPHLKLPDVIPGLSEPDEFLDLMEISIDFGTTEIGYLAGGSRRRGIPFSAIEVKLNELFERHRFGFRIEDGEARRVGSPALDEVVTQPALLALRRPGWEEADRSFREALSHQRGGPEERDDALTAATAALEAALKAAGLHGDRLATLAKSFRNSDLVPGQLAGVPEALDSLLKRSGAIRDPLSDAHGKEPGAAEVPQALVDLSIYWTGAFINYLCEATSET